MTTNDPEVIFVNNIEFDIGIKKDLRKSLPLYQDKYYTVVHIGDEFVVSDTVYVPEDGGVVVIENDWITHTYYETGKIVAFIRKYPSVNSRIKHVISSYVKDNTIVDIFSDWEDSECT